MFNTVELNFIRECVESTLEGYTEKAKKAEPNTHEALELTSDSMVLQNIINKVNGMRGVKPKVPAMKEAAH